MHPAFLLNSAKIVISSPLVERPSFFSRWGPLFWPVLEFENNLYALIKKTKIFLIDKEIQKGSRAKSYIRKSFLIYEKMGIRKRLGIGLSYRPARLDRLEESIPGLLKSLKTPSPNSSSGGGEGGGLHRHHELKISERLQLKFLTSILCHGLLNKSYYMEKRCFVDALMLSLVSLVFGG